MKQLTVAEALGKRKQVWLAAETGLDKGTVSRLVSGEIENPSNDTVRRLERALKLRPGTRLLFGHAEVAKAS